jgi:Peptidase A4 family
VSISRFVPPAFLALALSATALLAATTSGHANAAPGHPVREASTVREAAAVRGARVVAPDQELTSYGPNWAGYVASGARFRFVKATFRIPYLDCQKTPGTTKDPAMFADWVGLDGMGTGQVTVEQDGISGQCERGEPTYFAWWEMFPKAPIYPDTATVNPGDTIETSVYYVARVREYELILTDVTNGEGFTTWQRCSASSCANATAEVITEDPGKGVHNSSEYWPLADCGETTFWHIGITDYAGQRDGLSSSNWQTTTLVMADSAGHTKDTVSGLAGGTEFRTYWERTS